MDNRIQLAAALIRVFEGLRLTAYQDSVGIWTIGYGHTAGVHEGDTCTEAQAEAWLAEDSAPLFALVADKPAVAAAALTSFGFNLGESVLKEVLATNASLLPYCHAGGKVVSGLVARRNLEQALIDSVAPIGS